MKETFDIMNKFEELIGESGSIFQNVNFTTIPERLVIFLFFIFRLL